jgi:hypothetical protein
MEMSAYHAMPDMSWPVDNATPWTLTAQHMNSPLESAKAAFLPSILLKTEPAFPNKSSPKSKIAKSLTPATPDSA